LLTSSIQMPCRAAQLRVRCASAGVTKLNCIAPVQI
jgi:hypothetical protein